VSGDAVPRTATGRADHEEAWEKNGSGYVGNHDNAEPDDCGMCQKIARIEAEAASLVPLDVPRLYKAMCFLDEDDPGAFNIVAISEPDTRPVAECLAAIYARLAAAEPS